MAELIKKNESIWCILSNKTQDTLTFDSFEELMVFHDKFISEEKCQIVLQNKEEVENECRS